MAQPGISLGKGIIGNVFGLTFVGHNLFVRGDFGLAGDSQAAFVAQWDGQTWSALGTGHGNALIGDVPVVAADPENVIVGGQILSAGDVEANNLVRLNGTNWSRVGMGVPDGYVYKTILAGSNVYVAGSFAMPEVGATNLACWNGSRWSSLGSGLSGDFLTANPFGRAINALAAIGTNLYVAGHFTSAGGVAATNLAAWDGSVWSAVGAGISIQTYSSGTTNSYPG